MTAAAAYAVRVFAISGTYLVAGSLALSLQSTSGISSLLWAPSAIGLAIVLVYGLRWWPGVALGSLAILLAHRVPLPPAVLVAMTDVIEVLFGWVLLNGAFHFRPELDRARDVVAFVVVCTLIALISASSSVAILISAGLVLPHQYFELWSAWWWSHLSGDLVVAPAILTLARPSKPLRARAWKPTEVALICIASVAMVVVVMGEWLPTWLPAASAPYYLLPLLIWAGMRFGPRGAALASLGVSLSAVVVHTLGVGPFYELIDLQAFVAISTISTLMLSAISSERLRAGERKAAIQGAALDAIITIDELGHIVELNPAAVALFQLHPARAVGRDITSLIIPPQLREDFAGRVREQAIRGTKMPIGERFRTTAMRAIDKTEFPIEIAVSRMDVDGQSLLTGFIRDVSAEVRAHEALEQLVADRTTELVSANAELARRDSLMRQAEQLAHLGSFEYDIATGALKWSDELYRIFGHEPGLLQPTLDSFLDAVHADDRRMVREALDRAIATRQPMALVERIVRPDGSRRTLQTLARVTLDRSGRAVGVIGCCQDITEREASEQIRSRLAQLVASSEDAIIGMSVTGTIQTWNAAATKLFGYEPDEAIGRPCSMLLPEATKARLAEVIGAVLRGEHINQYELAHRRRSGETFIAAVTTSPVLDAKGSVVALSKVVRDVTKEKEVEAQLRASLTEKEVLLREIHHRVKNNLQVIASLLHLQMSSEPGGGYESLVESQNRIQSMALVHQLLYQSKDLDRIDFREYLRKVTGRLADAYDGDRIHIEISAPALRLDIDRAIPSGLIVNELVTNALIHAFPGGRRGTIRISLEATDGTLALTVADDGVGIPADLRLEEVHTFGLRIARTLTAQLEGTMSITCDRGTVARIVFPYTKQPAQNT